MLFREIWKLKNSFRAYKSNSLKIVWCQVEVSENAGLYCSDLLEKLRQRTSIGDCTWKQFLSPSINWKARKGRGETAIIELSHVSSKKQVYQSSFIGCHSNSASWHNSLEVRHVRNFRTPPSGNYIALFRPKTMRKRSLWTLSWIPKSMLQYKANAHIQNACWSYQPCTDLTLPKSLQKTTWTEDAG